MLTITHIFHWYLMEKSLCNITSIKCDKHIRKRHVIINSRPCKVIERFRSGHGTVFLIAIDVLNGNKLTLRKYENESINAFEVIKREYILIEVDDGVLQYLDRNNIVELHVDPDSDIYRKIVTDWNDGKNLYITILTAPVQVASDKFVDESIVSAYRQEDVNVEPTKFAFYDKRFNL